PGADVHPPAGPLRHGERLRCAPGGVYQGAQWCGVQGEVMRNPTCGPGPRGEQLSTSDQLPRPKNGARPLTPGLWPVTQGPVTPLTRNPLPVCGSCTTPL